MCNYIEISNAALLSSHGTSANETGTQVFNSNALRFYNQDGKRRRKPSQTLAMRQQLIVFLSAAYPDIRRIKINDTGILFTARIWTYGGRVIHQKAYSLQNLYGLLNEGIRKVSA